MSKKSKGICAERELIHKFWGNGWSAVRVAGSGSIKYPTPDIVAGNNIRKIVIECKSSKSKYQRLSGKEILELQEFSKIFGAEPWIGVKFSRNQWYFLTVEDLKDTGENYSITMDIAKRRGFSFEEMVE